MQTFLTSLDSEMTSSGRRFRAVREPSVTVSTREWEIRIPITLHVTWHERYETATVVASLALPDLRTTAEQTDLSVALVHSMIGRPSSGGDLHPYLSSGARCESLKEAVIHVMKELGPSVAGYFENSQHAWCVEERSFTDEAAGGQFTLPQKYALATGDEGWRFVTPETAAARLGTSWSTRSFVNVNSVGDGVFMTNNKGSGYTSSQNAFTEGFFGQREPYFALTSDVAGLDHGILSALERVTVRRARMEAWLTRVHQQRGDSSAFGLVRSDLDNIEELIRPALTAEVDSLEKMLGERMGLSHLVAQLDRLGEAIDAQTTFRYENAVNRRVSRLTWVTVVLTLVTIGQGVLSFVSGR